MILLSMAGGKQPIKGLVSLEPLLRKVWEREFQVGPRHLAIDLVPQPFLLGVMITSFNWFFEI